MSKKILRWIGIIIVAFIVFLGVSSLILYYQDFFEPPDFSKLNDRRATTVFIDEWGERVREICDFCREFATLKEMGHFPKIAIKIEDKTFETRLMPYSLMGLLRGIIFQRGTSTITMQTTKNLLAEKELLRERSTPEGTWAHTRARLWRKSRELWLAPWLEYHFGRKNRWEILELYLNTTNCGNNIYGVKACSRRWFNGKEPHELNFPEAAWIAALWRSPRYGTLYSSLSADERALATKRNLILKQLADQNVITPDEQKEYANLPLPNDPHKEDRDPCRAMHASELARLQIGKQMSVADQGLTVSLTLNCHWQRTASDALRQSLSLMKARMRASIPEIDQDLWGVAIAMDARNGDIKVFTQEPGFTENQVRIEQIKRHAGSAAKVYATIAYLISGGRLSCEDEGSGRCLLNDSQSLSLLIKTGDGYRLKQFKNFPVKGIDRYLGSTEPLTCLARSQNNCFLSMVQGIRGGLGILPKEDVTEVLFRLGITPADLPQGSTDVLHPNLALRLGISQNHLDPGHTVVTGSVGISPWEMIRSWSGFYGPMMEPRMVDQVADDSGEIFTFAPKNYGNILAQLWIESQKEMMRRKEVERLKLLFPEKSRRTLYPPVFKSMTFDEEKLTKESETESQKLSLSLIRGLRAPVELPHGTAQLAKNGSKERNILPLDFQLACKTGTATNDDGDTTDNWIACRTPSYVMVVWIGRKDPRPMKSVDEKGEERQETGGQNALPVVIATFRDIYETIPKELFPESTDPNKPFRLAIVPPPAALATDPEEIINGNDF